MKVDYSRSFKKDYKKLSKKLKIQVGIRIELFKEDKFSPILNNHAIHHPYEGCRSINISGEGQIILPFEKKIEVRGAHNPFASCRVGAICSI